MQNERDTYEWKSSKIMDYHERQLQTPYRSTVLFEEFLLENTSGGQNSFFEVGNLYEMNPNWKNNIDGALCLQTLSKLPEYEEALKNICDLEPKWIGLSLLGYEGRINYNIGVENYENLTPDGEYTHSWYNIYSLPLMKEFLNAHGYDKFVYKEFEIDLDLKKPDSMDMGTYTIMTAEKREYKCPVQL